MDLSHIVDRLHEKYDRGRSMLNNSVPEFLGMDAADAVKWLYKKYDSDFKYNTSILLSEVAANLGAMGLAALCSYSGMGDYASSIGGGLAGNYISAVAVFGLSWYILNKSEYKGKAKGFIKDIVEMELKNILPAAIQYIIYTPIATFFTNNGQRPDKSALYASLLSTAIYLAGSNMINQRVIRKFRRNGKNNDDGEKRTNGAEK